MTNGTQSTGTSELSVTRLLGPVVAAGGLFLILLSRLHQLPWDVPKRTLVVVFLVSGAYALTAWGLAFVEWRGRRATLGQVMVFAGAASLPGPLAYGVLQPPVGFGLVLIGLGAVVALTLGTFLLRGSTRWTLAAQGTLAVAAGAAQAVNFSTVQNASNVVSEFLDTSLYDLDAVYFKPLPESQWFQGGITRFGDRYLLAYGNGELYVFSRSARDKLDIERLAYETPINIADFEAAAGTQVAVNRFRVADALSQPTPTGLRLFVTHHYWNVRDGCWVMRVSSLEGSLEELLSPSAPLQWNTVYETAPCIGLAVTAADPVRFSGMENGGKMVFLDDTRLLVTFGDHEMNGWATTVAAAQDPAGSYGKTILIDLTTRQGEMFTLGNRNPQGLHVSDSGTIWATEHGPQGGDELNRLVQGRNYGWPLATYGVEYGTNVWPLTQRPGVHEGFEPPFFSWIPSIGVSAVLEVTSPRFENWRGDLLVSSLVGQTLWRLRVRGEHVELAEQIRVGRRIRDLEEGHDGELVMWTDDHAIAFIAPGEGVASGEYLYRVCAACHVAPAGMTTAVGPPLVDIVGREVASVRGFGYSPALEELGGTWTREQLDAYLRDPRAMVPGTTMYFAGLEDEQAREVLLDYLESSSSRLDVAPLAPL